MQHTCKSDSNQQSTHSHIPQTSIIQKHILEERSGLEEIGECHSIELAEFYLGHLPVRIRAEITRICCCLHLRLLLVLIIPKRMIRIFFVRCNPSNPSSTFSMLSTSLGLSPKPIQCWPGRSSKRTWWMLCLPFRTSETENLIHSKNEDPQFLSPSTKHRSNIGPSDEVNSNLFSTVLDSTHQCM